MTTTCPDCGVTYGMGASPFCSHLHEPMSSVRQPAVTYPGGLRLMNMGVPGETIVYSESERRQIMAERGLREGVWHVPEPGSDKSPTTTSWAASSPWHMAEVAKMLERIENERGGSRPDGRLETLRVGFEYNPVKAFVKA